MVTSLALVDPSTKKWWLFEATPDIKEQLHLFQQITKEAYSFLPDGIFLTHGHIGHYTGLMELGREAMNAVSVPVYALPRMKNYLTDNGPWSLLVQLKNISLQDLIADVPVFISSNLSVTPFLVPHRDEFTETAGFSIQWENKKVLFIPDIDKWEKFNRKIDSLVQQSTLAFLDATFFKDGELEGRSMAEVPHPFVTESKQKFRNLSKADKKKIYFIHFNHTNPLLNPNSSEFRQTALEYNVATQGAVIQFPH
jgi:pyrroloquinoline quinone biosynthesis protein B